MKTIIKEKFEHSRWQKVVDYFYKIKWFIKPRWEKLYCRYFGIKPHIIRTKLEPAYWYDVDTRMLYGMMQLLVEYIDGEKCFEYINWDSNKEHKDAASEIKEIRAWWDNYENRLKEINDATHKWYEYSQRKNELNYSNAKDLELLDKSFEIENKLVQEEEEMLVRLVKIRKFLWT